MKYKIVHLQDGYGDDIYRLKIRFLFFWFYYRYNGIFTYIKEFNTLEDAKNYIDILDCAEKRNIRKKIDSRNIR